MPKPCPFCGREPRVVESDPTLAIIYCPSVKCGVEFRRYDADLKKARRKVIRVWNKRTNLKGE